LELVNAWMGMWLERDLQWVEPLGWWDDENRVRSMFVCFVDVVGEEFVRH
jgi:hypothetical protein